MKFIQHFLIRFTKNQFFLIAAALCAGSITAPGQGPITPPGAPAPTMKSLDQVKAGTPIDPTQPGFSYPYNISVPGNYYLTANLTVNGTNAINITASGVTLDLNGFTISSTSSSAFGYGVLLFNAGDVTIMNGHIAGGVTFDGNSFSSGPGFQYGIYVPLPGYGNIRVSGVSVSGCSASGIELGFEFSNVVDHCVVRVVGGQGIHAGVVESSTAYQCGSHAINSLTVTNCYGVSTNSSHGVFTYNATNCYGVSSSGFGISAVSASGCSGVSSSNHGIDAVTASDCSGTSTSNVGLYASDTANNSVGTSTSGIGLQALNATNCRGRTTTGSYGLYTAYSATGCYGVSNGLGTGLFATTALNCTGGSSTGTGLSTKTATNCYASSSSGTGLTAEVATGCNAISVNSTGLSTSLAENCSATSSNGTGLQATRTAISSYGATFTNSAIGLQVSGIASYCSGYNQAGGTAINCAIGIGCTTFGGAIVAPQGKFLGTP